MVWSIMPTSHMCENIFTILENTEYKIEVSKYYDHNEKSQNPKMPIIMRKYIIKLQIPITLTSLHIPNNFYKRISFITFPFFLKTFLIL